MKTRLPLAWPWAQRSEKRMNCMDVFDNSRFFKEPTQSL
jgi:hypothetical protein